MVNCTGSNPVPGTNFNQHLLIMETYTVLAISTSHMTKKDNDVLHSITHRHPHGLDHPFANMVMNRDTGYFMKLYDEADLNDLTLHPKVIDEGMRFSPALQKVIMYAHSEGHRMIEFDCDAPEYPELFETFNW